MDFRPKTRSFRSVHGGFNNGFKSREQIPMNGKRRNAQSIIFQQCLRYNERKERDNVCSSDEEGPVVWSAMFTDEIVWFKFREQISQSADSVTNDLTKWQNRFLTSFYH